MKNDLQELHQEVNDLFEKVCRTRYQFLRAEIQTCLTGLDMGRHELAVGNRPFALREAEVVEKGISTIRRFLTDVSGPQRAELETKMSELEKGLEALIADLDA